MANIVLQPDLQAFPVATSVGLYPESAFPTEYLKNAAGPSGAAVETVAVAAGGSLTFTLGVAGTRYVAYAAAPARYIRCIGN